MKQHACSIISWYVPASEWKSEPLFSHVFYLTRFLVHSFNNVQLSHHAYVCVFDCYVADSSLFSLGFFSFSRTHVHDPSVDPLNATAFGDAVRPV